MTALDRLFVKLRFGALLFPVGLLVWLHAASTPVTLALIGFTAAYNMVAWLAIQKRAVPRLTRPMAVLFLPSSTRSVG